MEVYGYDREKIEQLYEDFNYELKEEAIDNLNKLIKIADGYNTIEEFLLSFAIDKEKYYDGCIFFRIWI